MAPADLGSRISFADRRRQSAGWSRSAFPAVYSGLADLGTNKPTAHCAAIVVR